MHVQSRSNSFVSITRLSAAFVAAIFLATGVAPAAPINMKNPVVRLRVTLHDGQTATVYADGLETLSNKTGKVIRRALVPPGLSTDLSRDVTASKGDLLAPLLTPKPRQPFAPNQLIVVFAAGAAPSVDAFAVSKARLAKLRAAKPAQFAAMAVPAYSSDSRLNRVFAQIGVDRLTRIARHISRSRLSMLRAQTVSKSGGRAMLDVADAFVVHVTNAPIDRALTLLRKQAAVAYAEHNWYVSVVRPPSWELGAKALAQARERELRSQLGAHELRAAQGFVQHAIPSNYAVSSSAQSLLNEPGVDAVRAYDEIMETYNQLPGQGETIANVSIGDIDDTVNTSDPCYNWAEGYGPSVHLIAGQHYIDWPSMPLIPVYVVDSNGAASGSAEACGQDPSLGEVGLDFSMMAPLPHQLQRASEIGSGYTDLLGIAPGAQYRLYVPQYDETSPATSDILAAFLAAAEAPSPPNVITASLGFGFDTYGFPGRYFEDDPLVESVVSQIVNGLGIVFCLSANDGTRTYTNVAIGSSGGSASTSVVSAPAPQTNLEDVTYTTLPSQDYDSGAIDVGGTTLDDIFAAPQNGSASTTAYQNQLTWPETRWTGFANFSSGFGSRVNISAPSDNILALSHTDTGSFEPYDNVTVELTGGTSAAAPEVAAVAAVAQQVARLTGHPFASPQALRSFLIENARSVPNVPQADTKVDVGPQADLGKVVDTLLAKGGKHPSFAAPRVAIAQRRPVATSYDTSFTTDTAPALIDMQDPYATNIDSLAPITIAPDWEGLPAGAKYRLTVNGKPSAVLATTPWVRLTPAQILAAAGLPLASASNRTVQLQYSASVGARAVQPSFSLTFGPAGATHGGGAPPAVAPVVSGTTMSVTYDLANLQSVQNPTLVVSEPGRMIPTFDEGYPSLFHPAYSVALTQTSGTVRIPVSALQGAGIYGIQVQYGPDWWQSTDFAFTHVLQGSSTQANPVTLSSDGVDFSHSLGLNYAQQYQVHWDVSNVPNATGAIVEISPPAPNNFNNYNSFNNPNGSIPDNNGIDTASFYKQTVSGKTGTITLNSATTLTPALWNTIRVIPMSGATPAGEASPVSSITMDGIVPPDGLPLAYYTAGDGTTGTIATADGLGDADAYALSETSPYSTTFLMTAAASEPSPQYFIPMGTVFPGDMQVMGWWYDNQLSAGQTDYYTMVPYLWPLDAGTLSNANPGMQLTTPSGYAVGNVAYNRQSDLAVWLLACQTGSGSASGSGSSCSNAYGIASMTLPSTTLGPVYNATAAYQPPALFGGVQEGPGDYSAGNLEVDPGLNAAVLEAGSTIGSASNSDPCVWQGHEVSLISLANGAITTFATGGLAYPLQSSYDSVNHVLVSPDACGNMVITNVQTQTNSVIPLPGSSIESPIYDVVDSVHHVILMGFELDPSFETNNAAMSLIDEYDENGNLLKSFNDVQFYNELLTSYMQIDENTRTMFVPELTGTQIEPLTY
jgi:hypothetical protein